MTRYLFLFTISPVQSFIAQARKTHDLWAGSRLLSSLIFETITEAEKKFNAEIIFPSHNTGISIPNRFIAKVESADIKIFGEQLEAFARDHFVSVAEKTLPNNSPAEANEQLRELLKIYWAAAPFQEDYRTTYQRLETMLASIKNSRLFSQTNQGPGLKCSLCGERIALFYRSDSETETGLSTRTKKRLAKCARPLRGDERLQGSEGLCAVGWLKRTYLAKQTFASTARIALADIWPWLMQKRSSNSEVKDVLENSDGQLYYKENLTEHYFEKQNLDTKKLKKVKGHVEHLYQLAKEESALKYFPKYYALLMLDGDSVGDWQSGRKLIDTSQFNDESFEDYHQHVTKKLGEYAQKVNDYFGADQRRGSLVYAGGDDVLAFINLHHLVETLKNLRNDLPDLDGTGRYTASAGVVIAHYKMPLSEVLAWARKTEKKAKKQDPAKKDKLALSVLKQSGEICQTVLPWKIVSQNGSDNYLPLNILQNLLQLWNSKKLSTNFVTAIENVFTKLLSEDELLMDVPGVSHGMVSSEIKRTVKRAAFPKFKKDPVVENIIRDMSVLASHISLKHFIEFLNIADFIHRRTTSWL